MNLHTTELSIGEVASRTGLNVSTIRMWEHRYGFPAPRRGDGRHRRYTEHDCAILRAAVRERDAGLTVAAALERARRSVEEPASIYAGLRARWPELPSMVLSKRAMFAISRAIEDEVVARAARPVLVGAFQEARSWRASATRWRDLARTAHVAVVLADLPRRSCRDNVWEVPLPSDSPVRREWAVICDAAGMRAVLVGAERPGQRSVSDLDRCYEAFWTVDPAVVRAASRIAISIAAKVAPAIDAVAAERLVDREIAVPDTLQLSTTLTNRIVTAMDAAHRPTPRRARHAGVEPRRR